MRDDTVIETLENQCQMMLFVRKLDCVEIQNFNFDFGNSLETSSFYNDKHYWEIRGFNFNYWKCMVNQRCSFTISRIAAKFRVLISNRETSWKQ